MTLCFDYALLADYLDGTSEAERFLEYYEDEPWAVSNVVVYDVLAGTLHGCVDGDVPTIRQAITSSIDVLNVTEQTIVEAVSLQEELIARGVTADHRDALVAANAREHGAKFATAERRFWGSDVEEVLDVAEYDLD